MTGDDGGYVHEPSAVDQRSEGGSDADWLDEPTHPETGDREFGVRGWVLLGVVLLAFVIAPLIVLLIPPEAEGYRFALLIVPLGPAIVLGLTAIWVTTRP